MTSRAGHGDCARADRATGADSAAATRLRQHLADSVAADDFARRLKTLRGLTPYEAICKASTDEPDRFTQNPHHRIPGPNI